MLTKTKYELVLSYSWTQLAIGKLLTHLLNSTASAFLKGKTTARRPTKTLIRYGMVFLQNGWLQKLLMMQDRNVKKVRDRLGNLLIISSAEAFGILCVACFFVRGTDSETITRS